MRALRYLYVLALALWLGSITTAGFVVAPTTFGVLEAWNPSTGRVLAGQVFGGVLRRVYLIGAVAGFVMFLALTLQRVIGPRPRHYGVRVGLLGLMLAMTIYSSRIIAPRIDVLQAQVAGPMNQLPADDVRRVEFDGLHSLSTVLASVSIVGGLLLLVWETKE